MEDRTPYQMMTLDQIRAATISIEVAREAYEQSSERLADVLDSKKVLEQKAQTFFAAYVAAALALISTAGALSSQTDQRWIVVGLVISGLFFFAGAAFCAAAQLDKLYAGAGSCPKQWLHHGAIDGPADGLPKLLAYLTWHRQSEIDRSARLNAEKATNIRRALYSGLGAVVSLAALVTFSLMAPDSPSAPNQAAEGGVVKQEAVGAVE